MWSLKERQMRSLVLASILYLPLVTSTPVDPNPETHKQFLDVTKRSTYLVERQEADGDVEEEAESGTGPLRSGESDHSTQSAATGH